MHEFKELEHSHFYGIIIQLCSTSPDPQSFKSPKYLSQAKSLKILSQLQDPLKSKISNKSFHLSHLN